MGPLRIALFVVGYPVAVACIARWVPVVRERRVRWFTAHQAAVAAIVAGWAIDGGDVERNVGAVVVNGAWFVAAAAWWWWAGSTNRRVTRGAPTLRRWPRN